MCGLGRLHGHSATPLSFPPQTRGAGHRCHHCALVLTSEARHDKPACLARRGSATPERVRVDASWIRASVSWLLLSGPPRPPRAAGDRRVEEPLDRNVERAREPNEHMDRHVVSSFHTTQIASVDLHQRRKFLLRHRRRLAQFEHALPERPAHSVRLVHRRESTRDPSTQTGAESPVIRKGGIHGGNDERGCAQEQESRASAGRQHRCVTNGGFHARRVRTALSSGRQLRLSRRAGTSEWLRARLRTDGESPGLADVLRHCRETERRGLRFGGALRPPRDQGPSQPPASHRARRRRLRGRSQIRPLPLVAAAVVGRFGIRLARWACGQDHR